MDLMTMMPDRAGAPSDKMDGPAAVGQFLREVSLVDLVVELVQNDLDAGATRTSVDFGEHGLACEGDGEALNAKAWARLESVIGAGGDIEAKRDGIGSKNHGLRSLFRLADRIGLQSAGLRTDLTLRGDLKRPAKFKPAFWPRQADPSAPARGTRILAPYRQTSIKVPDGDNTTMLPLKTGELDDLWRQAVEDAPERFIAASRPGAQWRYTLQLTRHGLGDVIYRFDCSPVGSGPKGLWLRTCRMRADGGPWRTILRRHALRFTSIIDDGGKIPRLFKSGGRVWGEVNWRVDAAGRPVPTRGRLRYPIAFTGLEARSGHGFDISAAFIAGRSRHDISADRRNAELVRQAREAFAAAGELLGRHYGMGAAPLIRDVEPRGTDLAAERAIVAGLLRAGGLCAASFGKDAVPKVVGHRLLSPGAGFTIATPSDERAGSLANLTGLAAASGAVLHPATAEFVREHLLGLQGEETTLSLFGELDAARLVLITENKVAGAGGDVAVRRSAAALQLLEAAQRKSGVPTEFVDELKAGGALPTFDGRCVAWRVARRLDRAPPTIPGVAAPPVVHPSIAQHAILTKGGVSIRKFDLDEYLAALDFKPTAQSVRRRYFGWLASNADTLKAATLRTIADMPVWPGADGEHRPLSSYCHPRARTLQRLLASSLIAPAPAVVSLLASSKLPTKSPRLRTEPKDAELLAWHTKTLADVKAQTDADESQRLLEDLESDIAWVVERHPTVTTRLGAAHETLNQEGVLELVTKLHVPSMAAIACGLPGSALTRRKGSALYERLGAHGRPTPGAVLTALRDDPVADRLFVRLEAYKRGSQDLASLAAERILPVAGGVLAAEDCAFVGEPDFWGEWKTAIEGDGVADHHALLSQLGVTKARATKDLSVSFFDWLSKQTRAVQQRHHAQIDRHWKDSAGPSNWIAANQDVPCIPVTSASKPFELVSLADAMRSSEAIFLDDFPEIRSDVLAHGKLRLTLIRAAGTRSTILDLLARVGIRSLRAAAGSPRAVGGSGSLELVPDLGLELSQLQTRKRLADLRARLPLHGVVVTSEMRPEWQKMLKAIKGVRSRQKLTAVYRLLGRDYEIPVRSGYDRGSELVVVAADSDRLHEMYEVLADYLFRPGRSNAWGLLRAARDQRQLEFLATGLEPSDELEGDDEPEDGDEDVKDGDEGGVEKGHGLSAAKLTPVTPAPKVLPPIQNPTLVPRRRSHTPKARSPSSATQSLEEEDQKRALKQEHYGYHCQACIGEMDVLKAAPPGTYVYAPGYRQRLLQAHHVQHRQNGGGLGAGNLIVLCEYHHRLWGDALSRGSVLAGLVQATSLKRSFPTDEAGKVLQSHTGLLVKVPISTAPFEARLYFTVEHAEAWRRDGS